MGSRAKPGPAGGRTSKALSRWLDLNERQRAYLEAVYRADQNEEAFQRSAWRRGWERRPADEWRWLLYHHEFSPIRAKLLRLGLVDKGTGSTFAALEERGLLLTRHARERVGRGIATGPSAKFGT